MHTEILLPVYASPTFQDRSVLWNGVEQIEKNKNAQLAREIELTLLMELSREQNVSLVREYVNRHFVSAGMCADVCIHDKNGERILLESDAFKTRKIDATDWNEQTKVEEWRAGWADSVNSTLERQDLEERVDHRSFLRQSKEQIPTVHLGMAAAQIERKGIATERGNLNHEIETGNRLLHQLWVRINKLKDWLKTEAANTTPPTLSDVIRGILDGHEQKSHYGQIVDSNTAARVFNFLQENLITDMAGLRKKLGEMYDRRLDMGDRLNRIDGRLHMLDEHIWHMGYYQEHGEIYRQYQQIKRPKKQAAFREQYYTEIALFESAYRYLEQHLNGHISPLKLWKDERTKLLTERAALNGQYNTLKEEVKEAEIVKRNVERLMS